MENNKQTGLNIKQKDGLKVKISQKQRRYQVTEKQLLAIMENKLEAILTKSPQFDDADQKKAFIKPGNIITLIDPLPDFPVGQIAIDKIKRGKNGAIKLINPFGTESPWFQSEQELIDAIDWVWMGKNIITKEYEQ
jgi:hypothetical protein